MSMARFARASRLALATFAAALLSLCLFAASSAYAGTSGSGGVDVPDGWNETTPDTYGIISGDLPSDVGVIVEQPGSALEIPVYGLSENTSAGTVVASNDIKATVTLTEDVAPKGSTVYLWGGSVDGGGWLYESGDYESWKSAGTFAFNLVVNGKVVESAPNCSLDVTFPLKYWANGSEYHDVAVITLTNEQADRASRGFEYEQADTATPTLMTKGAVATAHWDGISGGWVSWQTQPDWMPPELIDEDEDLVRVSPTGMSAWVFISKATTEVGPAGSMYRLYNPYSGEHFLHSFDRRMQ